VKKIKQLLGNAIAVKIKLRGEKWLHNKKLMQQKLAFVN
jgi:hypothetical protein